MACFILSGIDEQGLLQSVDTAVEMNSDDRGSFTERIHTEDCGQVSINIFKPRKKF